VEADHAARSEIGFPGRGHNRTIVASITGLFAACKTHNVGNSGCRLLIAVDHSLSNCLVENVILPIILLDQLVSKQQQALGFHRQHAN
jgi:hypothetical protein